jgi:predicted SAM-dependent methyltransferase
MRFLNLACGDHYVTSDLWENCDFAPKSKSVRQVDLLNGLPYENNTFDLVYCSHFIEHIPRNEVLNFLRECIRVLKPNGMIRLVLPDFENIAREYINNIDKGEFLHAEFNIVEMIDQCTRNESGGELLKWYERTKLDSDLKTYIKLRTGYTYKDKRKKNNVFYRIQNLNILKFKYKIQLMYTKVIVSILPKWYRVNHISRTATGEKHLWVYDYRCLSSILNRVGFHSVLKSDAHTSSNSLFPNFPLDIDENRETRKGAESMYLEANK